MKDPTKIFACLQRIQKDPTKAMNASTVHYANKQHWLKSWEVGYLLDTQKLRYSKMSRKQQFKRQEVNKIVVRNVGAAKRPSSH